MSVINVAIELLPWDMVVIRGGSDTGGISMVEHTIRRKKSSKGIILIPAHVVAAIIITIIGKLTDRCPVRGVDLCVGTE